MTATAGEKKQVPRKPGTKSKKPAAESKKAARKPKQEPAEAEASAAKPVPRPKASAKPKASSKKPKPARKRSADPEGTTVQGGSERTVSTETPAKKASKPKAAARKTGAGGVAKKPSKKAAEQAPLPGPEVKRAPKKVTKKATTQEKLDTVELQQVAEGKRPLDGIRVLDLTRLLPGPYASHILASFGAEVIKIEKPGEGDYIRDYEPKTQGVNAVYLTVNRGKKSLAIDLKHPLGKEAFRALVKRSDVVLDGFRPGVMDRIDLGYSQLAEVNPRLIYAALTGYGQDGPNAQAAGHDLNYIAFAGMLDLLSEADGRPAAPGIQIADVAAGALPTVIGILLALQHRTKSHKGQLVDVSMFDSLLGLMPVQIANYTATKRRPKRGHERLFGKYACYNIYPVRNGRFLSVAALEPKFWKALCTALGREELVDEQYVEGDAQQVLIAELTRTFQKKSVSEWMEIFGEQDVCVAEVRDISRVVQDEHLAQRGIVAPVRGKDGTVYEQLGVFPKLSEAPGYVAGDAPLRGQHTRQLLKSLGLPAKQINEMLADKAAEQNSAS